MKRVFLGAIALSSLLLSRPSASAQAMGSNAKCTNAAGQNVFCGSDVTPISASLLGATAGAAAGFVNVATDSAITSAISAAGSVPTVLQLTQGVSITSAHTIPANITFRLDTAGQFLNGGGSLAFTEGRQIQTAVNQRVFASGLSVSGLTGDIPVEWFGAVGNGSTSGSGTDSTAAIQATLNALTSGNALIGPHIYITSSALSITRPNLGIFGTSQGYSYPASSPASVIVSTSATADVLDLTGASASSPLVWPKVYNVALERSVVPTGTTTAGISASFVCGGDIRGVTVQDSTYGFHMHATPGCGFVVQDSSAGWGYLGVSKSSYTSQNLIGWYLDSSDGNAENSIYLRNVSASFPGSASASNAVGMLVQGSALNDVNVDYFATAYVPAGLKVNQTGYGNSYSSQDLHFHWLTLDTTSACAISINGLSSNYRASLTMDDSWISGTGTGLCASNSAGLNLEAAQMYSTGPTSFATGVNLSNVTGSIFSGNFIQGTTALTLASSPGNSFGANQFVGAMAFDNASLTAWASSNTISGSVSDSSGSIPQVTAGTYTCANTTVNKYGVLTAITNGTCTGEGASQSATDNFTGSGPLGSNWTASSTNGSYGITKSSGVLTSTAATHGATANYAYTGSGAWTDANQNATIVVEGNGELVPAVRMDTAGNGYAFDVNYGIIARITGGVESIAAVEVNYHQCSTTNITAGDVIKLSVSGNILTATDVTTGNYSCTWTDTNGAGGGAYFTSGYPGLIAVGTSTANAPFTAGSN